MAAAGDGLGGGDDDGVGVGDAVGDGDAMGDGVSSGGNVHALAMQARARINGPGCTLPRNVGMR